MKNLLIFLSGKMKPVCVLLFIVAFLHGCKDNQGNEIYGQQNGAEKYTIAKADFTCSVMQPLSVVINDMSSGSSVEYDFGDGSTKTYLPNCKITYRYDKVGTYIIKAIANGTNGSSEMHKQITINTPQIYVSGITFASVDVQDEYYRFKLDDDGPIVIKTWVGPYWTTEILYSSILPKTYMIPNPVLLEHPEKYTNYTLYVYHNSKASGNGTQCLKQNIPVASTFLKYPEYIEKSNNSGKTKVRLLLKYQ